MWISKKQRSCFLAYYFCVCITSLTVFVIIRNWIIVRQNSEFVSFWSKPPKLFCFIITSSPVQMQRIPPLVNTWLPRCDRFEIHSDKPLRPFPTVILHNYSSINETWRKLRFSIAHLYQTAMEYDWFLRSCDNTYFLVDNLRPFLQDKNPDEAHYYGLILPIKNSTDHYNSGSGFVLSRGAIKFLAEKILPNKSQCPEFETSEDDVEIAKCLMNGGNIQPERTKDHLGKERFHDSHFNDLHNYNRLGYSLSKTAISFHRLLPNEMLFMDYLLYGIRGKK